MRDEEYKSLPSDGLVRTLPMRAGMPLELVPYPMVNTSAAGFPTNSATSFSNV